MKGRLGYTVSSKLQGENLSQKNKEQAEKGQEEGQRPCSGHAGQKSSYPQKVTRVVNPTNILRLACQHSVPILI